MAPKIRGTEARPSMHVRQLQTVLNPMTSKFHEWTLTIQAPNVNFSPRPWSASGRLQLSSQGNMVDLDCLTLKKHAFDLRYQKKSLFLPSTAMYCKHTSMSVRYLFVSQGAIEMQRQDLDTSFNEGDWRWSWE